LVYCKQRLIMKTGALYKNCRLCPRSCGVDRLAGQAGYCGEGADLRIAFAGLHLGEEPPLTGEGGSGTVFVSGCNLRCSICQNWQISNGTKGADGCRTGGGECLGRAVTTGEFAEICLALQNGGAENVNIVTGSHAVPALVDGITAAKTAGLGIPVVWNSSGYENPETLDLLDGLVDTWLPDLKTLDTALAARLFNAPGYPAAAVPAILWMTRNRPGKVIIRHLILPGYLDSTRAVLRWFADNAASNGALLSLMSQYTPIKGSGEWGVGSGDRLRRYRQEGNLRPSVSVEGRNSDNNIASDSSPHTSNQKPYSLLPTPYSLPHRYLSRPEYDTVLGWLGEFGIEDGFCQDYVTGSDWLPDFTRTSPFSSGLSVPVWHWRNRIENEKNAENKVE
jgi:putative pyruvate formate lyase activating enzyme